MEKESTISVSRRTVRLALAFAVVLAVLAPVAVIAAGGTFVDDDNSIFEAEIEWMAANGITSACGPDTYCPNSNVTRGEMAAFMKRLATKKVVNAATAVTADNATTVGGYAADSLVRATGLQWPKLGGITLLTTTPVAPGATAALGQVSINAPVDGALVINGSLGMSCQGVLIGVCNQSSGSVYVDVDGSHYDRQTYIIDGGSSSSQAGQWNSSNTAYVIVSAGDHTVALDVENRSASAGTTHVWTGGINVMFVPFGADGTTP